MATSKTNRADAAARTNAGAALRKAGREAEAEGEFRAALAADPFQAGAMVNLGALLAGRRCGPEAEALYRRAIALEPKLAAAHNNLGLYLLDAGRFEEGVAALQAAVKLDGKNGETLNNFAAALQALGQFDKAMPLSVKASKLNPDLDIARLNLASMYLAQGDFARGWPAYEVRLSPRMPQNRQDIPDLPFPRWQGESLEGKSFLIWPEQGFGDELQFVRYATPLKQRGARRVVVRCKPALEALLRGATDVDQVFTSRTRIPLCDYWSPALSLPGMFGTKLDTIPAALPYLHVEAERVRRWQGRLPGGFKVGLVWKGARKHGNDAQRSLPSLDMLAPLWDVPGASFISLQKGEGEEEARGSRLPLVALGSEMTDFADAAAIVTQLNLVICVDTAIAHLAGALGQRVWTLLPAIATDWRWLRDRDDSPWYPRVMRLFRQGEDRDWQPVVAGVVKALRERVRTHGMLEAALAEHQARHWREALRGYERVLKADANEADAWHLKGLVQHELGNSQAAEQSIRRAIGLKDSALFRKNLGVLLKALRRSAQAPRAKDSRA